MSETTHQLGHLPGIPAGQGMIGYFANNPVAANLMMALMLLGGLLAGLRLTAQIFPTVDPGQIRVTVTYPGATPTEVEEGITRRVEESIFGIDGIDRVLSTATARGTTTRSCSSRSTPEVRNVGWNPHGHDQGTQQGPNKILGRGVTVVRTLHCMLGVASWAHKPLNAL